MCRQIQQDFFRESLFFTNRWSESTYFNSHTRSRRVGLNPLTVYQNTSAVCSTWCLSEALLDAWNVVTLHGHVHPAVTSWFLYSMPDEHLGAVDHARHDSVGVLSVCFRYLVGTQETGWNSHFTQFWQQIVMVCDQSMGNLPSSTTTSVPTNEVRNDFDRNPGLRSPRGVPPPLEIALWQMDNSQSQCVCVSYACIW